MATIRSFRMTAILAILVLAVGLGSAVELPLTKHTVSGVVNGARCVRAADLDSDGDLDLLVAAVADNEFLWIENTSGDGSTWVSHTIQSDMWTEGANSIGTADIDGDGDLDVFGSAGTSDRVMWFENDGTPATGTWTGRFVPSSFDAPNWVDAGDIDRDGDPDIVGAFTADDRIVWWESDDPLTNSWTSHVISATFLGPWSAVMTDLDGDGDLDVLATSLTANTIAWWESDGTPVDGGWIEHIVTSAFAFAHGAIPADFDGDGDVDLVSASFFDDIIAWWENDGSPTNGGWTMHTLSTSFDGAYDVSTADVDGDGDPDILGAASFDNEITWWENDGSPANGGWTEHVVDTVFSGASSVHVADVDGDGDSDILGAARMGNEVAWWENTSIHAQASFPSAAGAIVDSDFSGELPSSIAVSDLDRDGDLDLVAAAPDDNDIVWWENDGSPNQGGWAQHFVFAGVPQPSINAIDTADLDSNGYPDIAATFETSPSILWMQNDGTPASGSWNEYNPFDLPPMGEVQTADIDNNGHPDLLVQLDSHYVWMGNDGTPEGVSWYLGSFSDGSDRFVIPPGVADFDSDGKLDLASVTGFSPTPQLKWWRNIGRSQPGVPYAWDMYLVSDLTAHALGAADVDGDGDMDILVLEANKVSWWKNDGTPIDGGWVEHLVGAHLGSDEGTVRASDLDADGDLDIIITASLAGDLMWWENDGTPVNGGWTQHVVDDDLAGVMSVHAADIDADGDPDLVSAAETAGVMVYRPNHGGQFVLETTDVAPAAVLDDERVALLSVEMTHLGRSGEHDEELASFELLLESEPGVPMTTAHANATINTISIYLDTGDGVWTHGVDSLITTVGTLSLDNGAQTVDFTDGSSHCRLSPGESKLYFVAIQTTLNASQQSPNTMVVSHLTDATTNSAISTAEDRLYDIPLKMQWSADVASRQVLFFFSDPIFADDFELGNTGAWDSVVGAP